ncbi:MAG: hypothetical protein V3V01_02870 [Acidimicrobiales bacterium]
MKHLAAILALLALAASACGSSSGGSASADSPLAQAIADSIEAEGDFTSTRADAECIGGRIVDGVGEDRLEELGVVPESAPGLDELDLTNDEINSVVDALDGCIDLVDLMIGEIAGGDDSLSSDDAKCLGDELGVDPIKKAMAAALGGTEVIPDDFQNSIIDAFAACDVIPN